MTILLVSALLICEVAIVAIAAILQPENAGWSYWGPTIWICLLLGLNWFISGSIFNVSDKQKMKSETGSVHGAIPGIGIVVLGYSLCSIALLLATSIFGLLNWKVQFTVQIAGLALTGTIVIVMLIAVKGAQYGSEGLVSKRELLELLRRVKRGSEDPAILAKLEECINYVSFKMPHPSKLDQSSISRCRDLLIDCNPSNLSEITELCGKIKAL